MKSATANRAPRSQTCSCSFSRPLDERKRTTSESSESAAMTANAATVGACIQAGRKPAGFSML